MDYRILLVAACIFARGMCADLSIGTCTITDDLISGNTITIQIDDDGKVDQTFKVNEGTISMTPIDDDDETNPYVLISVNDDGSELTIVTNDEFKNFEVDQEVHVDSPFSLVTNFTLTCNDGATQEVKFELSITDKNENPPVFSFPSYEFKLPKMLEPGYDLSTVIKSDPIYIEDIDFSNKNITLQITPSQPLTIEARPLDPTSNRKFVAILSVEAQYNISAPMTFTVTATDDSDTPLTATATITISAPTMIGECTIEDDGLLDFGFFEKTVKDTDTDFSWSFAYDGKLDFTTPDSDDTGAQYIDVTQDDDKKLITFSLNSDNFPYFDDDHKSVLRQPAITVFRSVEFSCGVETVGFTVGLVVEDTNNHAPTSSESSYKYDLPSPIMPKVDLTSTGDPIIFEDVDFSNTDITFSIDPPFSVETAYVESVDNKRQYRAIIRVSEYIYDFDGDKSLTVQLNATDSGNPPLSSDPIEIEISLKSK